MLQDKDAEKSKNVMKAMLHMDKIDIETSYWNNPKTGALELYDTAEDGQWSFLPVFPSGAAGLVSTIDDYLAFGQDHDDRSADAQTEGGFRSPWLL